MRFSPEFITRSSDPDNDTPGLLIAALNIVVADERTLDGPEDLTGKTTAQIGLYAHLCQDSRTSKKRPGRELLHTSFPCGVFSSSYSSGRDRGSSHQELRGSFRMAIGQVVRTMLKTHVFADTVEERIVGQDLTHHTF
jgi:hypothetical protein